MKLEFAPNEFTVHELLYYLRGAYRLQINGTPFRYYHVANWIRLEKMPVAYGGRKITGIQRIDSFGNHPVLTIEGLDREVLESTTLYLKIEPIKPPLSARQQPRKQRTKLYYQLLGERSKQYTLKTQAAATLPDDWKEMGIKQNQLKRRKSKSKDAI